MNRTESPLLSIVIPSYQGINLLRTHLPSVLTAAEQTGPYELIVVLDDGGSDGSAAFLKELAPEARVSVNERNLGFSGSINRGIAAARGTYTLLLNNDVSLAPDAIVLMLENFKSEDVFGVSPSVMEEFGGRQLGFANLLTLRPGRLGIHRHYTTIERQAGAEYPTLYLSGGISLVRTDRLKELGAFSPLYAPWYWEDTDLSLRAWRAGYRCLYEPNAMAYHKHSQTIGRLTERQRSIRIDQRRNKILFHWAHLEGMSLFCHNLILIARLCLAWIVLDFGFYWALLAARGRRGELKRWREENRHRFTRSLEEIERLLKTTLTRTEVVLRD